MSAGPPQGPSRDALYLGFTLAQLDRLDSLVRSLAPHGDVVAAGHGTLLEPATVPALGEAIYTAAQGVRAALEEMTTQRVERHRGAAPAPAPAPAVATDVPGAPLAPVLSGLRADLQAAQARLRLAGQAAGGQVASPVEVAGTCHAVAGVLGTWVARLEPARE